MLRPPITGHNGQVGLLLFPIMRLKSMAFMIKILLDLLTSYLNYLSD